MRTFQDCKLITDKEKDVIKVSSFYRNNVIASRRIASKLIAENRCKGKYTIQVYTIDNSAIK